jgi:hypothetical protein
LTHLREGGSKEDVAAKIELWRKQWNDYISKK